MSGPNMQQTSLLHLQEVVAHSPISSDQCILPVTTVQLVHELNCCTREGKMHTVILVLATITALEALVANMQGLHVCVLDQVSKCIYFGCKVRRERKEGKKGGKGRREGEEGGHGRRVKKCTILSFII